MRQAVIDLVGADRFDLALAVVAIGLPLAVLLSMLYGYGLLWPLPQVWDEEAQSRDEELSGAESAEAD